MTAVTKVLSNANASVQVLQGGWALEQTAHNAGSDWELEVIPAIEWIRMGVGRQQIKHP
jgi:hypothetical protein